MRLLCVFTFLSFISSFMAQPDNDACADAVVINEGMNQSFNSVSASTDGPEHPDAACFSFGGDNVHNDIWYLYTATNNGYMEWSTCGTVNFDTRLAVYSSANCPVEANELLACNDDGIGCTNFSSQLLFEAEAGQTYLLRLGGYVEGDFGAGTFNLISIPDPDFSQHSDCENRDFVAVVTQEQADANEGWVYGNNFLAPAEDGVAPPACIPQGEFYDVWYSFNTGSNDTIFFNFEAETDSASFVLELYSDCQTVAPTFADGGELFIGCFIMQDGFEGQLEFLAFENPADYIMRIATQITNDFPGNFRFQLIGQDEAVGLLEPENLSFNLFPNPTAGEVSVDMPFEKGHIQITDLNGRFVWDQYLNNFQTIDLSNLPKGMYIVTLHSKEYTLQEKLVIK